MRRFLPLLPLLIAAIPDKPPPPIELTPDEQALVAARKIATRFDPGSGSAASVIGVEDVAAPIDATWKALLDLEARKSEIGGVIALTLESSGPDRIVARWQVRILTETIVFHMVYELDPADHFVRFHLDPTQQSDLVSVDGAYQLYPVGDRTRFVYWSSTDSGHSFPVWVKQWLATHTLGEQLEGIRARAEAGR